MRRSAQIPPTSTEYDSISADHGTLAVYPDRLGVGIITSRFPRQFQECTPRFRQFVWWSIWNKNPIISYKIDTGSFNREDSFSHSIHGVTLIIP